MSKDKSKKPQSHPKRRVTTNRHRRAHTINVYRLEHILQAMKAKTIKEYRAKMRLVVDDDKLWHALELLEDHDKASRGYTDIALDRVRRIQGGKGNA
jgi:hypothetical protein